MDIHVGTCQELGLSFESICGNDYSEGQIPGRQSAEMMACLLNSQLKPYALALEPFAA